MSTTPKSRSDSMSSTSDLANEHTEDSSVTEQSQIDPSKIPPRDKHLVNGYLREHQRLFPGQNNRYYTLHSINLVILLYCAGMEVIDRYGFLIEHSVPEQEHRKRIQKENERLLKWQDMIFPKKKGGATAEADNELDAQIMHWNSVKKHKKLKSRIRKGIPNQLRGTIWQNLCGARERAKAGIARYGSQSLYNDLKRRSDLPKELQIQIWKDINRTYRENIAFGGVNVNSLNKSKSASSNSDSPNQKGTSKFFKYTIHESATTHKDLKSKATPTQMAVFHVLKVFALYRNDVGYCQGMQNVVSLLIMYMTEEEAFWVLASIADDSKYQMEILWRGGMPGIKLRFYQMERLVKSLLPKLHSHFEKNDIISCSMYQGTQWLLTMFLATTMRFDTITRIWDIYLNEGLKTIFRMGIGYLKYFEKVLLNSDFEQMLGIFSAGGSEVEPEKYIQTCFEIRVTHAQLAGYEKDFNKSKRNGK